MILEQSTRSDDKKIESSRVYLQKPYNVDTTKMNCMYLPLVVHEVASGHLVVAAVPL